SVQIRDIRVIRVLYKNKNKSVCRLKDQNMKYGICAAPDSAIAAQLAQIGYDFIEINVQSHLKSTEDEAAFAPELERIRSCPMPCVAANCLLPGNLKVTGPSVDRDAVARYLGVAFERAQRAGVETVVFGSGGARRVPDGFDREKAENQLVEFCRMIGPIAQANGVVMVVEPLNQAECNILTGVRECADLVRAANHPNVRLLVDAYHSMRENENPADILEAASLLAHVHIATCQSRRAPGIEECDFSAFFAALRKGGYDGRVSIECSWKEMPAEAAAALATMKSYENH
ncbi:MAG: sugar phosphate isomerase/epimerase, partial [Candidatus Sumerlaeota bacterium]|nr:sugar phosphate isomerase/epimerase [Candidatus Sumerlaeota bacterium]